MGVRNVTQLRSSNGPVPAQVRNWAARGGGGGGVVTRGGGAFLSFRTGVRCTSTTLGMRAGFLRGCVLLGIIA